nr:hypothetical protein [Comamonas jiangduensis]
MALPLSPEKPSSTPNTSNGMASLAMLMFCPAKASSQMPLVAPKLAPNSTAMLPAKEIKPVLKNAMVSSDTRVLDCSTKVAAVPNSSPLKGVAVLLESHCSSLPPARLLRPCSRLCMPNRNKAKPAHSTSQPALYQNDHAKAAKASTMRECLE